jgi:dTDP-glucose 4,6-dehydratase
MKRVLLTGASGFIGYHCLKYFLEKTNWFVVCLDSFRHKGRYSRLAELKLDPSRVSVLRHDLSVPIDESLENKILDKRIDPTGELGESKLDIIINMASDSAVERSVSDPGSCWRNNCELIFNMLEFAKRVRPSVFFQVSSDEVYGDCPEGYSHPEWDVIAPSNPYAASKAAQEALAISYFRTFGVPVVITNTMNTIGTCQDKEKFLPKIIWKVATGQTLDIYSDPRPDGSFKIGTRFYLHAENHADVFLWLSDKKVSLYSDGSQRPDRYNVVGDVELNNLELAQMVADIMGKKLNYRLVKSDSARPGYDRRYALDGSKLSSMGWKPPVNFRFGLENVVKWTLDHPWWI